MACAVDNAPVALGTEQTSLLERTTEEDAAGAVEAVLSDATAAAEDEPEAEQTEEEKAAVAAREAFEAKMRAEDEAAGKPHRLRYIDLSKIVWGMPSIPKETELTAGEKKVQMKAKIKAAREAAAAGRPVEDEVEYGPSVFMNYGGRKFSSLRCRFTSQRRIPFNPTNGYKKVWLDRTKDAKINICVNDDPSEDPALLSDPDTAMEKVQARIQEQDEEMAKLKYIQESAIDHVTAYSEILLGVDMTREQVVGCMCGLLGTSKKAPGKFSLAMKWCVPSPDPEKAVSQIINVTGFDYNEDGTVAKVHWQKGDCTTCPKFSYLIPDIKLAHSLWFRQGVSPSWGFNTLLHRTPCYPPRKRERNVVKVTADDAADLIPEATGDALQQNEELVKVPEVGDISSEEEDEGTGVDDVAPASSRGKRKGRASASAVDAAVGGSKKRGRRSRDM